MIKYVNPKIERLHNKKSKLLTELNKTKKKNAMTPALRSHISNLQTQINDLKYAINKEFAIACTQYWANKEKDINYKDSATFFPNINSIYRPKRYKPIQNITVNKNDHHTIDNLQLKTDSLEEHLDHYIVNDTTTALDVIGAHFEHINEAKSVNPNNELHLKVENYYNSLSNEILLKKSNNVTFTTFSESNLATAPHHVHPNSNIFYSTFETHRVLKSLKNKTSAGIDSIPNVILKKIPPCFIRDYTIIFNNIINNSYFPTRWKTGKILPIAKKDKDPSESDSCRPISLLPNISKVLEALLNSTITSFVENNGIIPDFQYGFRHNHSTVNAVHKLTTDVCHYLNHS